MVVRHWGLVAGAVALALAAGAYFWRARPAPNLPVLRILAYDTFAGLSGPGPKLVEEFETNCQCRVEIWSGGDAGQLVEQLKIRQHAASIDLIIGLDQLTLPQAEKEWAWKTSSDLSIEWVEGVQPDGAFVPFDWAPLTFIYREGEIKPPQDWQDLAKPEYKRALSIPDARTSTAGRQFLFAIFATAGEAAVADFLQSLRPNLLSVPASWSESYGLFQRGQVQLTFSYVTSLVYHREVEHKVGFRAAIFSSGHPRQIEYMAISDRCVSCDLAKKFIQLMLSPSGQRQIMKANYMFPVLKGIVEQSAYANLPILPSFKRSPFNEFFANESDLLGIWARALK